MIRDVALAPFSTRFTAGSVVCTEDALAAEAGVGALRAGGCAVDATIAAAAVLAVTHQHQCGLGGDLLALVHREGDERPMALNASGRAGSGADPERLRSAGQGAMPDTGDLASVPVPGCVDGWLALHERFGRLSLDELLAPALHHAERGFAASPSLAAAAHGLQGVPGAEDFIRRGPLRPGEVVTRPGVARALDAIARRGREGFYGGEFGHALLELGGGEYTPEDLARPHADWVDALGVEAFERRVWSLPPNSQGYILLRSAVLASELELPGPEDPEWAARLIGVARTCAADRDAVWHEDSDGPSLIAPEVMAGLRTRQSAAAALAGDTVSLCVVDSDRMAVSLLQSNFVGWGSLVFVPGLGIPLHNRGSTFSLQRGHPAEYGAGRRPPHTLAPVLTTGNGGRFQAALATRGGVVQPQILLQLLARIYRGGEAPGEALAAARWAIDVRQVLLEGHAPEAWSEGLKAQGAQVVLREPFSDEFGHAQLIVSRDDHLAAASDPRSPSWAAAVL